MATNEGGPRARPAFRSAAARSNTPLAAYIGTMPGSLLLHGRRGVGKQRLALWLAQAMLCSTGSPPCGTCQPCRYATDLELLKRLNFDVFRFSIAWPRLLPGGTGKPNQKGIDFYDRVIDKCLSLGLEPWPTLYHWDLPQSLEDQGGWANRDVVDWFSAYTDLATRAFGDRVKNWMVLNEPFAFTTLGYFLGWHAPGRKGLKGFLPAVHHAALCQAEGGRTVQGTRRR